MVKARSRRKVRKVKRQILSDGGDPQRAPAFTAIFFDLIQAAEGQASGAAGLFFRHAGAHIVGDLLLEVKTQFFVQVQFQLLAVEKALPPVHDSSPCGSSRKSATTPVRRPQLSVSLFSCARPRAVSS